LRGNDYVVNKHIVTKNKSIKRKRWRRLESVLYPVHRDSSTNRDNFINVLAIALFDTFRKETYIKFTSIFRVSKKEKQGYEIIVYNLMSHQPEFAENIRRESSRHYNEVITLIERNADKKDIEKLNQKERERWEKCFDDWTVDLFPVPFRDSWSTIDLVYDAPSKYICIRPPEQVSTRIEDYDDNIETMSELFQFIAAISEFSTANFGNLVWLFGNYPLMKLITDIVEHRAVRLERIRINANDYEEWDYINKKYDQEVKEYERKRKTSSL
jgi:hypothetical protein